MNDNIATIAALQMRIDELQQTNAQMVAMIKAFEVYLESRYERLCGIISRGGNATDESEFTECSYSVSFWRKLKAQHLGVEVEVER